MSILTNNNNTLVTSPVLTVGSLITYFARIYPLSADKGGYGIIALQGPFATYRTMMAVWSVAPTYVLFFAGWTTTSQFWAPNTQMALGQWSSCGASYDFGVATNQPAVYMNGVNAGNTAVSNCAGTPRTDGVALYTCGDSLGTYDWNGSIADWAVWNRILTPLEHALVHVLGPLAVPSGLQIYYPFPSSVLSAADYSGNARNGTIANGTLGGIHNAEARQLPLAAGGPLIPTAARFDVKGVSYDPNTARLTYQLQEF